MDTKTIVQTLMEIARQINTRITIKGKLTEIKISSDCIEVELKGKQTSYSFTADEFIELLGNNILANGIE